MIWVRFTPDWRVRPLPSSTLMAFLAALGPGLLLTALTVKYRALRMSFESLIPQSLKIVCPTQ
jgi:lipopolysaccharide transport system permease protein